MIISVVRVIARHLKEKSKKNKKKKKQIPTPDRKRKSSNVKQVTRHVQRFVCHRYYYHQPSRSYYCRFHLTITILLSIIDCIICRDATFTILIERRRREIPVILYLLTENKKKKSNTIIPCMTT